MVQRTQITLQPEQHRRARRRAAELGVSLAEYVRGLVARDLGEGRAAGDVSSILDLGDTGGSDVRHLKDQYLAEAIDRVRSHRNR
ncbi:MAG: hypothetical protein FIA92_10200 [Chloroflexi bacterium]|nr:hypothetical protein [Chloroflexota bacterium]